nr:hypothetical protein CFP56_17578 [Quercus suber]
MDPHIPGAISFTDFLEDPNNEYVIGSSHISGEDSVQQAQVFSQMSPPEVESIAKKSQRGAYFSIQEDNLLVSAFLNVNQDVVQKPIDLEDEDIPHVPNVLERPPGKKAEKERLKKQKSKEVDRTSLGISITTQDVSTASEAEAEIEASAS